MRTSKRTWIALLLVFAAYLIGITIAVRDDEAGSTGDFIYGIIDLAEISLGLPHRS